jgi:predicted Zn-dependent peptidase
MMTSIPTTHKSVLQNGIRVLTKKMPFARSITMGVWVNVGARDESESENGLSHLIEHLIFKGTRRRTAFQIAKEFDAIGGQTNAFTTMENTCYHAKVIDTHLDTMVDILSDIFLNSRFDETEVEKERPVILQEIGMVEDTPDDYIHVLFGKNFWGDHPLGRSILGTPQNILQFNAHRIKDFFRRLYQPDRIIISAAGNLEHGRFMELVGTAFESIQPGNGFPDRHAPTGRSRVEIHQKNLEQVHICIGTHGLPTSHPKRYALSLMNTILGGNMSSRLFQEIREKRGLAYSVYAFVSTHVDAGMFGAYAAVEPSTTRESTELLLAQLLNLKKAPVDDGELSGAKEFIKGNLLLAAENTENQMVRLAQNEMHFGRNISLNEVVEHIEAVTPADILELADTLLNDHRISLTILGPASGAENLEDILHQTNP